MKRRPIPVLAALALALGCTVDEPPEPDADSYQWTAYANDAVGFTMEVPDVYGPNEEAGGRAVLFRWARGVPVKAYWTTASESEHRGLWFD